MRLAGLSRGIEKPSQHSWPRMGLHYAGITHGNVGRASCLRADVQRPNVINANGDRPQVLHSRRPERHTQTAGGRTARDLTTSMRASDSALAKRSAGERPAT